ncbi:GspE/PulE family protein [Synechococcus sp. RS9916]|uniref:GspE/PulE family protein n=1 Tax=Synechococcus sp. RS9916 TaxID=221359 RepID=UPI0000E53855|nr:GspE/PulE family protein [Synechococcus sp. RS9916]EAU75352.1 General secretion pathway protein E [Synechococcus sp. RS9916]
MRLTSHKRGKPAPSGHPSLAGSAVSQPQRLVLELLLQEAVPDKLDTTNHERLVKRLVDKGLAPAEHPRVAAALAALQSTGSAEATPPIDSSQPDANPDALVEEPLKASASDDDAINLDSLLSGFNSEGVLEENAEDQTRLTANHEDLEQTLRDTNASPVVNLVNRILLQALQLGASDIHVEPQQIGLQVRFRQDGVLQSYSEPLPARLVPAVTSRFKIMADLDIAERRQAQDGRIRRRFRDRTVDFRVNSLPSRFGEKIVLRLLDSSSTQLGLDKLISNPEALELVRALGSKPFGMILVTGPTGSGKSTTLYSLLAERNDPGINISTVEDPIEYTLPGITQCQVNREKGFDFSTALRAFMRQDPDVLLVGETRDLETAKTAIEAALTGHLVLTTLHCNDAPSAIARLGEMGVEPFMVSASLIGIVSQRLLRKVCSHCRQSYQPNATELARFGLMSHHESHVRFFRAHHHDGTGEPCPHCQGSGYQGRIGVYEVLRMNEQLATAVANGATTDVLRRLALESGMKTLLGYSLELVRKGQTTLEEVGRMILTDSGLESERRARALSTVTCEGCGGGLQEGWLECPYCLTPRQ